MSTYIIDRNPYKYGGQQQIYVEQVNGIVTNAADSFSHAVALKLDLTELFQQTLATFGEFRNQIAVNHGTEDAGFFGVRRDQEGSFAGHFAMTPLSHPYDAYNARLLCVIQKHLGTMEHTLERFQQAELQVTFAKCQGKSSALEISLIPRDMLKNLSNYLTVGTYQRLCKLCLVDPISTQDADQLLDNFTLLIVNKAAMQRLKLKSLDDYKNLKILLAIIHVRKNYPKGGKSDWILVTNRCEVNGKMYALSQYLTWVYFDRVHDPIQWMTDVSIISILHQDPFLVETMLTDIAKIFKRALEWNGEKIGDLKGHMALFRYELAHAMPFHRGSAAVAEWFERAIYRCHGLHITYAPEKMVDLESLTSPLKQFVEGYDSMIQLEKL